MTAGVVKLQSVIKSRLAKITFRLRKHSWDLAFHSSWPFFESRPMSLHGLIPLVRSAPAPLSIGVRVEHLGGVLGWAGIWSGCHAVRQGREAILPAVHRWVSVDLYRKSQALIRLWW